MECDLLSATWSHHKESNYNKIDSWRLTSDVDKCVFENVDKFMWVGEARYDLGCLFIIKVVVLVEIC